MKFSQEDIDYIISKGLTVEKIELQLQTFQKGLSFINLKSAATLNDGIIKLNKQQEQEFITLFEANKDDKSILKFVPASGAATRMFKFLFNFLKTYNTKQSSINAYVNKFNATELAVFMVGLEKLPFYKSVINSTKTYFKNYDSLSGNDKLVAFIKTMLDEDKLNYSKFPKGLLPFHNYQNYVANAFEEHLYEAALYAVSNKKAKLHFTISEKHLEQFKAACKEKQETIETKTNVIFDISYSFQSEQTDTIAVTSKLKPFRDEKNKLHFRPSGHGALLQNLNNLNADIIFIKNIDNIVVSKYKNEIASYKKILAGLLLDLQNKSFDFMRKIETKELTEPEIIEIAEFLRRQLNVIISSEFEKYSIKYQIEYLKEKLNKPIRICGMVKNEGEPGGGPFWVWNNTGTISLQIVESAQIDLNNLSQKQIIENATHFNPVDIVCGIKDYKGNVFNLDEFIDKNTGFITNKTHLGKTIKALELPGLWNGSMANWNSVFVEVPIRTFNPVKTVNDLLKPAHQL
ncbi:DUF4301 family protein [Aurantibacter sp.]|uniref:DUF4301 family protein n=1 Tax=Aurantibacter sp. TaxID=2807103 RepID=UPI0035C82474